MSATKLSKLFLTVAGLCTALGGMQAFQAFGDSTPLAHKVTSIIMGIGIVAAYLANSPLVKPATDAKPADTAGKVAGLALIVGLGVLGLSCAHVQPVLKCASDLVVESIKDAFSSPNWEADVAKLAVEDGAGVVECVVEQILSQVSTSSTPSPMVAHAKAWKASHPSK